MHRQSISFTEPNEAWLKEQVESEEYSSKSELVNDLIRQARGKQKQIDWLQAKLDKAKSSGVSTMNKDEMISYIKSEVHG